MSVIRLILNALWLITGGFVMALCWWFVGIILCLTIIGIPFARSCFVIGKLALWPFGHDVADRELITGREDLGTGSFGTLGNIVWFLLAGIWLAIAHIVIAFSLFITIIGIPFGMQHLKLAGLTLAPIGLTIYARA